VVILVVNGKCFVFDEEEFLVEKKRVKREIKRRSRKRLEW
jgi:hypothetical protein